MTPETLETLLKDVATQAGAVARRVVNRYTSGFATVGPLPLADDLLGIVAKLPQHHAEFRDLAKKSQILREWINDISGECRFRIADETTQEQSEICEFAQRIEAAARGLAAGIRIGSRMRPQPAEPEAWARGDYPDRIESEIGYPAGV